MEEFDYNTYTRFAGLIANNNDIISPKSKPLNWIMKYIEEIYDARFYHEKIDISKEEDFLSGNGSLNGSNVNGNYVSTEMNKMTTIIFPFFVIRYLTTVKGLVNITDQTCWDLLYNIHKYRSDYLEVSLLYLYFIFICFK